MYQPALKLNKKGVPFLTKEDMNTIGENLVYDFSPKAMMTPQAIDMDRFLVNYLGSEQDFQYLSHCGCYLGMTVFNDSDSVPVYNPKTNTANYISVKANTVIIDNRLLADEQEHRYRFTIGHESSHLILHTNYYSYTPNQISFYDKNTPMVQCRVSYTKKNNYKKYWTDAEKMEWQANYLSATILMPESMVKKLLLESKVKNLDEAIVVVSKCFNVSFESAKYRVKDIFEKK